MTTHSSWLGPLPTSQLHALRLYPEARKSATTPGHVGEEGMKPKQPGWSRRRASFRTSWTARSMTSDAGCPCSGGSSMSRASSASRNSPSHASSPASSSRRRTRISAASRASSSMASGDISSLSATAGSKVVSGTVSCLIPAHHITRHKNPPYPLPRCDLGGGVRGERRMRSVPAARCPTRRFPRTRTTVSRGCSPPACRASRSVSHRSIRYNEPVEPPEDVPAGTFRRG